MASASIATRSFRLSGRGLDKPWEVILEEIKKCDLRCKAHHVEVTRQQWADGLIQLNPHNRHRPAAPFVHGTSRTYVEKTCRCMCCRAARSLHRKKMLPFNELAHTTPTKGCLCNTKFQKRLVSKNFRKHHRHT